jgi:hypothetical protein
MGEEMIPQLDDYDWAEVFGEGMGGNCKPITPGRAPMDTTTPNTSFGREDVDLIMGQSEGENDERSWIVWGQLKDGRWFIARGECDYTGWDCRAGNSGDVAPTAELLIRFGMDIDERTRFGVAIP